MYQRLGHVAIVVEDYDDAIEFYSEKLGFDVLEDTKLDEYKRWVVLAPRGAKESGILLAKAANDEQRAAIGNQTGGRVGFFLFTDDFWRDYENLKLKEVHIERLPQEFEYGTVAVFADLYGNLWDLIEPNESNKGWIKS